MALKTDAENLEEAKENTAERFWKKTAKSATATKSIPATTATAKTTTKTNTTITTTSMEKKMMMTRKKRNIHLKR